jgi:hypothetical protein
MIEQLKTVNLANQFERFVKDFARQLEDNVLIDGRHIRSITVPTAGTEVVDHLLDRQPLGWVITDITEDRKRDRIYRTAWSTTTISLYNGAGTDTTLDIWIF